MSNAQIVEACELLHILERLRPHCRAVLMSVGRLLETNAEDLRLSDTLGYYLRLNSGQREGVIRLLQTMIEDEP